jgi:hypothetical protein
MSAAAFLGTITGAIAGGGKGAAIGAAAGAGAGTQILTRAKKVNVPAESLLTFRLEKLLQMGMANNGITRNGRHDHKTNRYFSINGSVVRSLAQQEPPGVDPD